MKSAKKIGVLAFCGVFVFSFVWMFILTYNFPLFWEDSVILDAHTQLVNHPEQFYSSTLFFEFINLISSPKQFLSLNYMERPLSQLFFKKPFFVAFLEVNSVLLRFFKAIIFSGLVCLYFFFVYFSFNIKNGERTLSFSDVNLLEYVLPFLFVCYFLAVPEVWIMVLYIIDTLPYSLFFSTIAIGLFYFSYYSKIKKTWQITVVFFLIVFFTHLASSLQHIGRINFILFFLFLLLTDKRKLLEVRYYSLIIFLFLISVPFLGIIKAFFVDGVSDVFGIGNHLGLERTGLLSIFLTFVKTLHYSFFPHALFLVLLFLFFIGFHLCSFFHRRHVFINRADTSLINLKKLVFFSLIWFLLSAFMIFIARTLIFEPKNFLRFEFSLFLFPQFLFMMSYCLYVYKKYCFKNVFIKCVVVLLIFLSIVHNIGRLNEWRGGWGAYFLGYDSARQYVDDHSNNSILLLPLDHASPTYFSPSSTNTHAMVEDLTNVSKITSYGPNYYSVYVASKENLVFNEVGISNIVNISVVDNSPYGRFKRIFKRYYLDTVHLYVLERKN